MLTPLNSVTYMLLSVPRRSVFPEKEHWAITVQNVIQVYSVSNSVLVN